MESEAQTKESEVDKSAEAEISEVSRSSEVPVTSFSEEKREEKKIRLSTIVVFGIQRGMKWETLFQKWV